MPIIYSIVARGTTVLAEFSAAQGNFAEVTRRILEKIPAQDSKMSYVYDKHIFHYVVNGGLTFLCMADEDFGRRIPFMYLEDIKNRFRSTYGDRGRTALAFAMNEDFSRTMSNLMDYYSKNTESDQITHVKSEIDSVKNIMVDNIEKVLERGERIELLVDKTETLQSNAFRFKKQSTALKRAMWWKNVKLTLVIVFVVLIVVYFIVALICGGLAFQRCVNTAKGETQPQTSGAMEVAPAAATLAVSLMAALLG